MPRLIKNTMITGYFFCRQRHFPVGNAIKTDFVVSCIVGEGYNNARGAVVACAESVSRNHNPWVNANVQVEDALYRRESKGRMVQGNWSGQALISESEPIALRRSADLHSM
jgi:hypothetical protein